MTHWGDSTGVVPARNAHLKLTPWFSPTVSRECRWLPEKFLQPDDFQSLPSHKWNVNSGRGRTTLFNFGFQTFFPSINWNSILDSDFDGGGWIYAAAPALPSADAINKPNVTLQQWQLAAVFHWEAPSFQQHAGVRPKAEKFGDFWEIFCFFAGEMCFMRRWVG